MKTRTAFYLLLLVSSSSYGWDRTTDTDMVTNVKTLTTFGYDHYRNNSLGVRCDVKGSRQEIMVTFLAEKPIDVPQSEVDFFVKVDNNELISFTARLFSNSYSSGYVSAAGSDKSDINKLIKQMRKGNTAHVRVQNTRRSEIINYNVDLNGFTNWSKETLGACGFGKQKIEMSAEDKNRLRRINEEIESLSAEKKAILSKY